MQRTQISTVIQSLRGSQAVVALAFLMLRQALTVEDLVEVTGIDPDTVRKSLKAMKGKGLFVFQTGPHGRQLWVPVEQSLFAFGLQSPKTSDSDLSQNPKTSDSGALILSSSSVANVPLPIEKEQEEEALESENFGLCMKACFEAGIKEPKASKISRLAHVTPEFIRGHVKQGKDNGVELGTVIYRIEHGWSFPAKYEERAVQGFDPSKAAAEFMGHELGCRCVECSFIRAMQGDTNLMCPTCHHRRCECED